MQFLPKYGMRGSSSFFLRWYASDLDNFTRILEQTLINKKDNVNSQSSNLRREKKINKNFRRLLHNPCGSYLYLSTNLLTQYIFRHISPGFVSFRFVSQNRIRPSLPSNSESEHDTTILIRPWTCIHENNP